MAYLLLADDDEDFADAMSMVLRNAGHEVVVVNDVKGALASVAKRRPDLALLDVMFPEDKSAGFRLARSIRRDAPDVPIIMLSAVNEATPLGFSPRDLDETGFADAEFLEKPVDFDLLLKRVSALLEEVKAT